MNEYLSTSPQFWSKEQLKIVELSYRADEFSKNGLTTLLVAGGIAGGIIFSSLIFYVIKNYIEFRKTK